MSHGQFYLRKSCDSLNRDTSIKPSVFETTVLEFRDCALYTEGIWHPCLGDKLLGHLGCLVQNIAGEEHTFL